MLGVKKIFFLALITVVFQFTNGALLYGQSSLDFSVDVPTGCSPLVVSFLTDSTLYHSHVWNFGDGSSSTLSNPQHIYSNGGSYTVSLIAVHNNGSIDTIVKPNLITINNSPLADYSISTNIACEKDDEVEFTNLSSNFVSSYWDFGDGTGSVLENPVHTFGTHGSYTISLIVYDTNGCFDSKEITNGVQVNPKPSGLISSSTLSTCDKNEIINFSFSNIAVSQYSWSFGDGSVSNLASPFHSYGQEGTFNVELITENSFGCTDTNQLAAGISILFNPVPEMNLSDSIFCLPASIGLSTNASNVANHTWSASNGFTSQAFSTTLSTSLVDTIGINLNVEYSNGCINSNNKTVVTLPTPAPSYGMLNSSGCAPLDVQLVNNTVGNYTWLWDFKDSTYSSLNNPIHTYNEAGTYIPILTATNSYGCSASWATPSFIRVNKPSANFISSVIGGCKPLEVEFICMSTGITQCQWNFGDGNTSLDINPVHVYSQIGSYNVMLIVTDIYGCTDTLTKADYISVGIEDVQINSQTINGCVPFNVQFASQNLTGTHLWDFGDGKTSTNSSPSHTFNQSGVYTVSYSFSSNSTSECSQTISEYATYIIGGGVPNYSVVQSVCPPYTASFTDSSINAIGWYWDFGDGNYSTDQHPTHVYTNPGNYNVSLTITSADGCTRTITKNYVVSFEPLLASPDAMQLNTTIPTNVQFTANSTGATGWLWDFGDGNSSTLQNPLHTYTVPGPYSLALTISNDTCSRTLNYPNITLGGGTDPLPGDSIIYSQSESFSGCVPYTVEFNSPVKNAVSYLWLFGNGDSSALANPTYVYQIPGIFDVTLITQDTAGNYDTLINPNAVNLYTLSAKFNTTNFIYCSNDSVVVLAQDSTANNYEWNFGQGTVAYGNTANHVYNQTDDYFISLRVSDSLGCEVFSNQLYSSGIQIEINSNKLNACTSDSIAFTSNYYPALDYLWDFGDGNTSSEINPFHAYENGGTYIVTLTLEDSLGCQFPVAENIEINIHEPIADFVINPMTGSCEYFKYEFLNNSQNEVTWHWDFGDGGTSNLENPKHIYSSLGSFDITLTVTKFNCISTYTDTTSVVNNELIADFNYLYDDKCKPVEVQFLNLSQNAIIYEWQFGDGTSSVLNEPVHTYNEILSDSIYLTVKDGKGCGKTVAKPIIELMENSFTVDNTSGCAPLTVQFTNTSIGFDSITWVVNDSIVADSNLTNMLFEDEGYYDVSLLLHSVNGCTDTLRKDSLIYVSNPEVNYTIDDTAICKPGIVNFTNLSSNVDFYHWNFGDGANSVGENPIHIYNKNGNYFTSLIGRSDLGCSDTISLDVPIDVQGPDAYFSLASVSVCQPKTVWFNDSSSQASFWFWDFGDGHTSTQAQPVHHYAEPGNYNVSLIVSDSIGCTSLYEYPNGVNIVDYTAINVNLDKTEGCAPLEINLTIPQNYSDSIYIDFGDGGIGSKSTSKHTYLLAGDYQIKYIRINEWGCIDTSYSDSIHVVPVPSAKFKVDNGIGCVPIEVEITDLSYDLSGATYLWNLGTHSSSIDSNFNVNYNIPGSHSISLIVTNESLCSDTFMLHNIIQGFDNTMPMEVEVNFVSVVDQNETEIQWEESIDPNVDYYNLFKLNIKSGLYELISNSKNGIKPIGGKYNYFDDNLNTSKYKYNYKVQAVNYCKNKMIIGDIDLHNSILLKVDSISMGGIQLSWNNYLQCDISGYEIYRANLSNGLFRLIGTVDDSQTDYLDADFNCPQPFMYIVKAINLCGKQYFSESNSVIAEPLINLSIQKVEVVRSTVVDDSFTLTEWLQPDFLPSLVTEYLVYRSIDSQNFSLVDRVPAYVTEFIDMDVEVDFESYFYKIVPVNICDVQAKESNNSSSILLQAEMKDEITKLKWSKYTEWDSGVEKYVIERMDFNGNWQVIKVVDGNTFEVIE